MAHRPHSYRHQTAQGHPRTGTRGELIPSFSERASAVRQAASLLRGHDTDCRLCPRRCGIDRHRSRGFCGCGVHPPVASYGPHHGEETVLSGRRGSGTVFFAGCNLRCIHCQNHDISHSADFPEHPPERLASLFLELQDLGCHNLNLVTPTHVAAAVASGLALALERGLRIPVVWNSGGYESADILRILEPCVDIYLPDLKFLDASLAHDIADAADYPSHATAAVREMFRQKGPLRLHNGLAVSGVIVRHLVLPGHLDNTRKVLRFLAEEVSTDITVSLMGQYHPAWNADSHPPLDRPLTPAEYREAVRTARDLGLHHLILQDLPRF